mmetsp:Transcript_43212/g.80403  ORF Transcript_43212/g.80403 Transcript_43212/m.80403 type:complete len:211 (+) Transcript_43212:3-635(+)
MMMMMMTMRRIRKCSGIPRHSFNWQCSLQWILQARLPAVSLELRCPLHLHRHPLLCHRSLEQWTLCLHRQLAACCWLLGQWGPTQERLPPPRLLALTHGSPAMERCPPLQAVSRLSPEFFSARGSRHLTRRHPLLPPPLLHSSPDRQRQFHQGLLSAPAIGQQPCHTSYGTMADLHIYRVHLQSATGIHVVRPETRRTTEHRAPTPVHSV